MNNPDQNLTNEKHFKKPENANLNEQIFTLLLDLKEEDVEFDKIQKQAEEEGFEKKEEFHSTAIGYPPGKKIKKVLKKMDASKKSKTKEQIMQLINNTDWSYILKPEIFHIKKDYQFKTHSETRESFIRLLDIPGLKTFYEKLNALLGTTFAVPPAHVTLCAKGTNPKTSKIGIGLYSEKDLEKLFVKEIKAEQ